MKLFKQRRNSARGRGKKVVAGGLTAAVSALMFSSVALRRVAPSER